MHVIQLEEWDGWRIAGCDNDWQVQRCTKDKDGFKWKGANFFQSLDAALGFAYEKTLRENGLVTDDLREVPKLCKKVKDSLLKAVRKELS